MLVFGSALVRYSSGWQASGKAGAIGYKMAGWIEHVKGFKKKMKARIIGIRLGSAFIAALSLLSSSFAQHPAITPKVDERVELLSIVFRLAGNREYSMSPLGNYTRDIDSYFAPYKNHPVVVLARKLAAQNGIGYDAVMSMAVHLSPPPALRPLVAFSDEVPEKRWGRSNALKFADLLRDFYQDTHFEKFASLHRPMYNLAEESFAATLQSVDLAWFARFYGEKPIERFHVLLGMNNGGGNYGIKVRFRDGHQEAFAIMGCWTTDSTGNPAYPSDAGYLPTVIHEFNHSFVNPLVERNWTKFNSAEKVFAPVADRMRSQAYGNAKEMVDESLVRAAVIVYSKASTDPHSLELSIRKEEANGFVWMEELYRLLEQYQADRRRYPQFENYMPVVARFYDSLAPRVSVELANYRNKCVHVIGLRPFANHSRSVDPGSREVIVSFDKPLDPTKGDPVNYGPKGKSEFPVAKKPEFLPGNKELRLRLDLKPNSSYSFVLAGASSPEGYPVEDYSVDFQTK